MDHAGAALTNPANRLPGGWPFALAALPLLFLAVFFAAPFVTVVSTTFDADSWRSAWNTPGLGSVVWFTVWQAMASTLLAFAFGIVPSYVLGRFRFAGRRVLRALVVVPFVLPAVAVGAGWLSILPTWLHDTPLAVIVAHGWVNIAVVVRVLGPAWQRVPLDRTAAARTLGAGPAGVARWVVWPSLRPAVGQAALIVASLCVTSFGIAAILGGPANATLEVEIVRRAAQQADVARAAPLATMQLLGLVLVGVAASTLGRPVRQGVGLAWRRPVSVRQRALVRICAATLTLVVAAPIAALALRSLRVGGEWTRRGWTLSPVRTAAGLTTGVDLGEALSTSLLVAAVATVTAVLVGVTASLAIDATRRRPTSAGRPLRATITVVTVAPLATSAVMVGLGLLVTFDTSPVDWRQSWWLIPVCHATIATPFVVAICQPTLRAMPDSWLDASSTLGATPARSWRAMQLRRVVRQLPAAAGVAAVISLGDFGASTMLSRTGSPTAPVAVGSLLTRAGDLPRTQGLAGATILAMLCGLCAVAVDRSSEAPT